MLQQKRENWELWIPFSNPRKMLVMRGECGAKVVVGLIGANVGHEELVCFELKTVDLSTLILIFCVVTLTALFLHTL